MTETSYVLVKINPCIVSSPDVTQQLPHPCSIFWNVIPGMLNGLRMAARILWRAEAPQITKFMGPTWGSPGPCRPQMGPMLAPWTLILGTQGSALVEDPARSAGECKGVAKAQPPHTSDRNNARATICTRSRTRCTKKLSMSTMTP